MLNANLEDRCVQMSQPIELLGNRRFSAVERGVFVCRGVVLDSCKYLLMNSQISS